MLKPLHSSQSHVFVSTLTRGIVVVLAVLAIGLTPAPAVSAQTTVASAPMCPDGCVPKRGVCALACRGERGVCQHAAGVDFERCNDDCRSTATTRDELRRCSYQCKVDLRVANTRCKLHRPVCRNVCDRPMKDRECVKGCAGRLRECVADVHVKGRACADECRDLPDALQGPCLRGCYQLSKAGARACWQDFTTCVDNCPAVVPGAVDTTPAP